MIDLDEEITIRFAGLRLAHGDHSQTVIVRRASGVARIAGDPVAGSVRTNRLMQLAMQDERVGRAFDLLGASDLSDDDMVEILSIIEGDVGGEADLIRLGAATAHDIGRLKRSFSGERRMTLRGTESLVIRLLSGWMMSLTP